MTKAEGEEIKAAIAYYESIGADWADVVAFLAMRAAGRLEAYMFPWRAEYRGRPRKVRP